MTHVDSESLVRENAECKELLLEAMRYHLLPGVVTNAILSSFYFKVVDSPGTVCFLDKWAQTIRGHRGGGGPP